MWQRFMLISDAWQNSCGMGEEGVSCAGQLETTVWEPKVAMFMENFVAKIRWRRHLAQMTS